MPRRSYLVTYDIADDQRRARAVRILRDHGDRVQLSVFRCELNARERIHLERVLHECLHHGEDQALFVDLGPASDDDSADIRAIGRPYRPELRTRIV